MTGGHRVLWFRDIGIDDVPRVGGKNASLGELIRALEPAGIRVPDGFATTADAYRELIAHGDLGPRIATELAAYRSGTASLAATGEAVREALLAAELPPELAVEIREAYRELGRRSGIPHPAVAVRSSATAEDLPDASFAGQQETFLNVVGERQLLEACRRCYASLFTDRAIDYRRAKGFDDLDVALSIGVQRMVRSDVGASGVMFSLDPESGFPRVVVISAAWGLGELVVQGVVDPDRYTVFTPLLGDASLRPIIEREVGAKEQKMVHARGGTARTRTVATTRRERDSLVLDDADVLQLARWAAAVAEHYGRPMDMEWAKDGATGELFLVQARPETVHSTRSGASFVVHRLTGTGPVLVRGAAIGDGIAAGEVCVIRDPSEMARFRDGAILVTEMTDPDWGPVMARAAGIVTEHGGTTSHAAIVSRERGIPAVVGTGNATSSLRDGQAVTLSCAEGEEGRVYAGILPFEREQIDPGSIPSTTTRLLVNVASPDAAFRWWRLPAAGVGLARMEFIVSDRIRVHPMALVHPERVSDPAERERIAGLTRGWPDGSAYFVDTLARGLATIAAPFHPHPTIVRMSDFKSNEYARLLGGADFERPEENPMLGFRGASRYDDPRYREGFELECRAVRMARSEFGFASIAVMIPFCRTLDEADRVLALMARNGLERGVDGLRVHMMCELPANVVLAERFATRFDGFSIGSNDLTQLTLGVDRDAEDLAALFDERDPAVLRMIELAIEGAHAAGIEVGICGQAPSDHPEFAEFLVRRGIDAISLNPDSFLRTAQHVAEVERSIRPVAVTG
ncbi:phosphoenolpyruvate synthase [Pseudolysinimonas sp.]|uniref:phosphoenolpyruvate synthase n=1 Tax=Pseudolysinimonas sp. TaxID=2680009 RepID=UPI003F7D063B